MNYQGYRKAVNILKKHCKLDYPIIVRRVPLPYELDGTCQLTDKKYIVKINRLLPEYYAIDVLIHEVAHAMSWDKDKDFHGMNWGKAYSKAYRIFLKEYFGKDSD